MTDQIFSDLSDEMDEPLNETPRYRRVGLLEWIGRYLFGQWKAGVEDRKIVKELGGTVKCPNCGRENSARTPVCPRCEHRFE